MITFALIGWVIVWFFLLFVIGFEILALMRKEEDWPTWSRMVWRIQMRWPWTRWLFLFLVIAISGTWTIWLSIHFFFGECAFGLC